MNAIITEHALERIAERMGLSADSARRAVETALAEGLAHSELSGRLQRYVSGLYLHLRTANNIRIYGEFVYLFDKNVCITILHLPNEFKKTVRKLVMKKGGAK